MQNIKEITEQLKILKIPYDKTFFNMKFSHYEQLAEQIGMGKVYNAMREILMYHRHDKTIAEKARMVLRKLSRSKLMVESTQQEKEACECGFLLLGEEYEFCPCCNKQLYFGKECFYKEEDWCTLDEGDCVYLNRKECGKEV